MLSYQHQIKLEDHQQGFHNFSSIQSPFIISHKSEISFETFKTAARWTMLEQAKYAAFIDVHAPDMEGKPMGKLWTEFKEMAELIKSRNFRQCKSFHQKMILEYKNIACILSSLSKSSSKFHLLFSLEKDKLIHSGATFQNTETNESFSKFGKDDIIGMLPTDESYYPEQIERVETGIPLFNTFGKFPSMINMGNQKMCKKDQEWKECHELFIEWTRRLKALLEPRSYA